MDKTFVKNPLDQSGHFFPKSGFSIYLTLMTPNLMQNIERKKTNEPVMRSCVAN